MPGTEYSSGCDSGSSTLVHMADGRGDELRVTVRVLTPSVENWSSELVPVTPMIFLNIHLLYKEVIYSNPTRLIAAKFKY